MIDIQDIELSQTLKDSISQYLIDIDEFRQTGPLDDMALLKLETYFKTAHIYHSTGIEGNRLTLQETNLVLRDGIDIRGKPLQDTVDVKQLGIAFDYLKDMSSQRDSITEVDIRNLHQLIVGDNETLFPGNYRKIGVVISGSEHRPPEPIAVPYRMEALVAWINLNLDKNPIILSTVAHHELTAIHPFVDGNGPVSRLLMNLILLKRGLPICNIKRDDRPNYYEALTVADSGVYQPLIELIYRRSAELFSEYLRIRDETRRMAEWTQKWSVQASKTLLKRELQEMELWQSRMRLLTLEFQKATELLSDKLQEQLQISFYEYRTQISFENYQQLREQGEIEGGNVFSISFRLNSGQYERFIFRYFRHKDRFSDNHTAIPLTIHYYDVESGMYIHLASLTWADKIRIRELYFSEVGQLIVRYNDPVTKADKEEKGYTVVEIAHWFFDDLLQNVFGF